MLIAADANMISVDIIAATAEQYIDAGLIYVCVWGPDCERVHDIFDEVHVGDGSVEPVITLMSTWHSDASLEEAIWYFLESARPLDTSVGTILRTLQSRLVETAWEQTIEKALSDIPTFSDRILEQESKYAADETC